MFSVGLGSIIVGLALARWLDTGIESYYPVLTLIPALIAIYRREILSLVIVIFFCVTLGWWRGGNVLREYSALEDIMRQKVTLLVTAQSDGVYTDKAQVIFDASDINLVNDEASYLYRGRLVVSGYGTADVRRGDKLYVEGKLYPTRGSRQARMSFAQLKPYTRSSSVIEKFRRSFLAGIRNALPEPLASFGAGLLIGTSRDIDQDLTNTLRLVGLSHVIAVSGYNLTILAEYFRKKIRMKSRYQEVVVMLLIVAAFMLVAGSSASIARASMVAVISIILGYFGRELKSVYLILIVAAATAYVNPYNLWFDIGWHLSFLAFYGVLVLAPLVRYRLKLNNNPKLLSQVIIESGCATIMTLPLTMTIFGGLPTLGLLANIIVVPLVPLGMLFTTIAGLTGMISLSLAGTIALPAKYILTFMLDIAQLLSSTSFSFLNIKMSVMAMSLVYSCLLLFCVGLYRYHASKELELARELYRLD
jgi:competence protein ComEC